MKRALVAALLAFTVLPASASAVTWTRENPTPIVVPDPFVSDEETAPYPSTIAVADLPGQITKVTATLGGADGSLWGEYVDVAATSPAGQNAMLMSDVCGGRLSAGEGLTFDDAAPTRLPEGPSACGAGTYKPTNIDSLFDGFASPGPVAPFGRTVSVFNGGSPNGIWSLFAVDSLAFDGYDHLFGGWSLTVTTDASETCAGRQGTIFGTDAADDIRGTSGRDVIVDFGGRDVIRGLGGNDVICGGDDRDRLLGGPGKDRLLGQRGKDVLRGQKGKDVLRGGKGDDREKQ